MVCSAVNRASNVPPLCDDALPSYPWSQCQGSGQAATAEFGGGFGRGHLLVAHALADLVEMVDPELGVTPLELSEPVGFAFRGDALAPQAEMHGLLRSPRAF